MSAPSIAGALDYGLVVPLIGTIEALSGRHSPVLMVVVAIHGGAAAVMWVAAAAAMVKTTLAAAAVAAAMWAATVAIVETTATAPTVVLVGLSPVSFVLAWPLALSPWRWHRTAAVGIRLVQVFAAGGAVFLVNAATLHEAWGCYPPGSPMRAHDLGMCGSGVTSRQTGPGFVCRNNSRAAPGTCDPAGTPMQFYGDLIAFVVHAELLAMVLWTMAYFDLALESSLPRPSTKPQPPPAAAAAVPFI